MSFLKPLIAIFLLLLSSAPAMAADLTLNLDTSKTRAPISKYIYSQFIEHLGNSVYQGLWDEMIEDRKFCHPITDNYAPLGIGEDKNWLSGPFPFLAASPWKVIGPPGTVTMDKDHPYVGDQTPVIHLPADGTPVGISVGNEPYNGAFGYLALVKGKKYTGHIILAGDCDGPITVELKYEGIIKHLISPMIHTIARVTPDFKSFPLEFTAEEDLDFISLRITSKGKGSFKIGTLSLMPSDNIKGFRPDTLAALKQLDAPLYRWPGGNFVSGYNWRDGIGDRDKRPPRKNPAWKNVEHNDVGIHEFFDLLELIHAEPYIALNTGKGTPEDAAAEMEYIIGGPDTPGGKLRAANGHPQPWTEKYWAVGNEMYGTWQLGYMPLADYVQKHNATASLLAKLDPKAILVACGDTNTKGWDAGMMTGSIEHFDLISEHTYVKEKPDPSAHAVQLRDSIKHIADAFRTDQTTFPRVKEKNVKIAMDEWNFWYGPYVYGELGTQYRLKDTLGTAMGLHEFYRNSDIFELACFAQTINVLGAIKTSRTAVSLEGSGYALALYRKLFGTLPIDLIQPSPDLDIAAALAPDKKTLTIAIVNHTTTPHEVALNLLGSALRPTGTTHEIRGTDPESKNEPGKDPTIKITEKLLPTPTSLPAPPLSVELYTLNVQ